MAFADLNLAGLAWQNRGLHYLLQDADIPDFASQHLASALIQATGPQGNGQKPARATGQPGRPGGRPDFVQGQPAGSGRHGWQPGPRTANAHAAVGHTGRNAVKQAEPARPSDPARPADFGNAEQIAPANHQYLPTEQWPQVWQQRLAKTRPGRIAWTYQELGRDFLAGNDLDTARRREFFGRLIRDLSHPAGSHTFWPACLPAQGKDGSLGENQYNPLVFWSGLKRLGARGIVVMDREVARAIGLPDSLRPLQQIMHNGFFVWFLWDAEVMSNDLERYGSMLAYLRSTLRMIVHP